MQFKNPPGRALRARRGRVGELHGHPPWSPWLEMHRGASHVPVGAWNCTQCAIEGGYVPPQVGGREVKPLVAVWK